MGWNWCSWKRKKSVIIADPEVKTVVGRVDGLETEVGLDEEVEAGLDGGIGTEAVGNEEDEVEAGTEAVGNEEAEAESEEVEGAIVEAVTLPEPAAILAMAYAPGYYLYEVEYHKIPQAPKYLCVHGLYHPKTLLEPPNDFPTKIEVMDYEYLEAVPTRINNQIPNISDIEPPVLMKLEMNKHGKHINFLRTPDEFATFALNCYDRYEFHGLLNFVAGRVAVEGIGQECVYLDMPWIEVKVSDFLRIANSFEPISRHHGEVNLQLLYKDKRYFLYEVRIYVTRDEMPASRRIKHPEVFVKKHKSKTENFSYDKYVYMTR